jgi:hypothetical protein
MLRYRTIKAGIQNRKTRYFIVPPPGPVKWQVTSISILVRPHTGRKFTHHIAWLTSITDKEPAGETLVAPLNLAFEIGRESGSRKVKVGQPESTTSALVESRDLRAEN